MKMKKSMVKSERGFTLVELLATIVILGIIAAIAVPSIGALLDNTKKDAHVANAQQIIEAARLKVLSDGAKTGDTFRLDKLANEGFLKSIPTVPGKETKYEGNSIVKFNGNNYSINLKTSEGNVFRGGLVSEDKLSRSIVK